MIKARVDMRGQRALRKRVQSLDQTVKDHEAYWDCCELTVHPINLLVRSLTRVPASS